MKKKRNFLTIISSILGVFTICSFCMFSIFTRSSERTNGVEAISYVTLNTYSDSDSVVYTNNSYTNSINYQYESKYTKVYDGSDEYFIFVIDFGYKLSNESTYYVLNEDLGFIDVHLETSRRNTSFTGEIDCVFNLISVDVGYSYSSPFVYYIDYIDFVFDLVVSDDLVTTTYPIYSRSSGTLFDSNNVQVYNSISVINACSNLSKSNLNIEMFSYNFVLEQTDYDLGYNDGYGNGYNDGYTQGYNDGSNQGYSSGYSVGYQEGVDSQQVNIDNAYQQGYSAGYTAGQTQDEVVTSIFSGILQVAMVPINFFLGIFNFEILGINLSAFIRAIFTVVLTIIVIKTVMGKGGGGSDN